ncbi:MAG: DUF1343 domain-containing protein [Deltaproteobacteria bacterium]|jgi:uncharacterized protein YbbC (DUF1343 family)|nr:DUF1343 domain-containing protein [Deltaproteobacteria bacterium]
MKSPPKVATGLELFAAEKASDYKGRKLGLLANQASVDRNYRHALSLLDKALPGGVVACLSPQHGFYGEKQDNMVESPHSFTSDGRPVYSLYGATRQPTTLMIEDLSALLVDLVDVGTRVYTFAQTLSLTMETCAKAGVEVVVLDRPNPIGGLQTEGCLLAPECASFVGLHPVPMRHGLTMGELAMLFAERLPSPPLLTVIACRGWSREMYHRETGLPWVLPSPNMPSPVTAWLYPGQVIFEATNLTEGRGTTKPFHLVGAPFIDPAAISKYLDKLDLPGVIFRPCWFEPSFNKWSGFICGGVELHPIDKSFLPLLTSLSILEATLRLYPDRFRLKDPPYEYEYERRPIDLILGRADVFDRLFGGASAREVWESFKGDLAEFERTRERLLLYR